MAQQTSIGWLREKLQETYDKERKLPLAYTFSLLNKAEQMEKEQSLELIKLSSQLTGAATVDEEIAKMEYIDVYNQYYK